MSNYLTLAVVTAALHEIVHEAVRDVFPSATVRIGAPRVARPGEMEVSVCLYRLKPSAALRNSALPAPSAAGASVPRPPAAVDLHYIISFSGESHLATELMLGKVLTAFHAKPVLSADEIRPVMRVDGPYPFLKESDLAEQPDRIQL